MRLRYVSCSGEFLVAAMKTGLDAAVVVENALPADARLIDIREEKTRWPCAVLIVESQAFDDVPEGHLIPEHPAIVFRKQAVTT